MQITGGTITSSNASAVYNSGGEMSISGNTSIEHYGDSGVTVSNTGIMDITGGSIVSESSNAINNKGTMSIVGYPTIQSPLKPTIANRETGILTISQLNLDAGTTNAILNYGQLEINEETTIINNASNLPTIYNYEGSSIVVNAGTITNNGGGYAVYRKSTDISITISPNANVSKYN